jgi:hypothetical protein
MATVIRNNRFALLLTLLCSGCWPVLAEIEGKACDAAHLCGGELTCSSGGVCVSAGGADGGTAPNLLENGGFESGPTTWRPSEGSVLEVQGVTFRSGVAALKVSSDGVATSVGYVGMSLDRTVLAGQTGKLYCAEAYVQRGSAVAPYTLYVRGIGASGSEDSTPNTNSRKSPVTGDWFQLKAELRLSPPNDASVVVRISAKDDPPNVLSFFVDDVRLWIAENDSCP